MKTTTLFLMLFTACTFMVPSCQNKQENPKKANKTFAEMYSTIIDKAQLGNYTLSDTDYKYVMAIEDSLLLRIQTDKDVETMQFNRTLGLFLMDFLMDGKNQSGKKMPANYLEDFVNKNLQLQFKFDVNENDEVIQFNLLDCFLPANHELSENDYCDTFDFFVYVDKKTLECQRIECILPHVFDEEEEKEFFASVTKTPGSADMESISSPKLVYDEEYKFWIAEFDPSLIKELLSSQSIYFMVGNTEDEIEKACINLTFFKEQYKAILEMKKQSC